jgi:hypothetical protein
MSNKVNSWDEFQSLEEVILGSLYDSSFFDDVKNPKIRSALKKIIDETHEDLDYFKSQMNSHGIKVYQATTKEMGYKDSIMDYVNVDGELGYKRNVGDDFFHTGVSASLIPNPPLQPRDDSIVMGNKILCTDPKTFATSKMIPMFKKWFGDENVDTTIEDKDFLFTRSDKNLRNFLQKENKEPTDENLAWARELNKLGGFCSPNLTRIGSTCFVDTWQTPTVVEDFLGKYYSEFNYKKITLGGHNDAIFSVVKPGVVVASRELTPHKDIFNGWDIIWFEDPNWDNVRHFRTLRFKNHGKWWVPGEESNDEFTYFVEGFLNNWVGQADETIFDVNCLVIDDKHVVVNSDNPYLIENLRKHNLEPVICPLRHSFFWDGGWHCLTLDAKRKGGQIDYGI